MQMKSSSVQNQGFTLVELMIVVALVAMLLLIALPGFQQQMLKTKRTVVQGELLQVVARQEQFFINNKQYAATLDLLGYVANPYAINADGNSIVTTASDRIYIIQLASATATSFSVQAVPQLDQVKDTQCGTLQITSTGVKTASSGTVSNCW